MGFASCISVSLHLHEYSEVPSSTACRDCCSGLGCACARHKTRKATSTIRVMIILFVPRPCRRIAKRDSARRMRAKRRDQLESLGAEVCTSAQLCKYMNGQSARFAPVITATLHSIHSLWALLKLVCNNTLESNRHRVHHTIVKKPSQDILGVFEIYGMHIKDGQTVLCHAMDVGAE